MKVPTFSIDHTFWLTVLATGAAGYGSIHGKTPAQQNFYSGVAASFFVIALGQAYKKIFKAFRSRRFTRFFGASKSKQQMYLVYPQFRLSGRADAALAAASIGPQHVFEKRESLYSAAHKIDLPRAVAVNDIESLLTVSNMFGEALNKVPGMRFDCEAVANSGDSFISFGFSSSDCTHQYLKECGKDSLFRITPEREPKRYSEFLEVHTLGKWRPFRSSEEAKLEIAIILKYRPKLETAKGVVRFICGGLGPEGTKGAGHYLSQCWEKLHSYAKEDNFLAVLSVSTTDSRNVQLLLVVAKERVLYDKGAE